VFDPSIFNGTLNLLGGYVYTIFIEGTLGASHIIQQVDFFPTPSSRLRVFHASPTIQTIDALVNGSSYGFNAVAYSTNTPYIPFQEGEHLVSFRQTNNPDVTYFSTNYLFDNNDFSIFFIGMNSTNSTNLDALVLKDDNTLPTTFGQVKIRFVHASVDAAGITIRSNGIAMFPSITYKSVSNYTSLSGQLLTFDALEAGTNAVLFTRSFDLRVKVQGTAVYTLVAEGLAHPKAGEPAFALYLFLDAGEGNPASTSSTGGSGGLSAVAIGLIIAGVAVFVIIVAAAGFVFWKRRHQRAGYDTIEPRSD